MRLLRSGFGLYAVFASGVPVGVVRRHPDVNRMWLAEGVDGRRGVFPRKRTAADWLAARIPVPVRDA
ncbi:hypothetical protein [Bifidobacterium felsineum]|uniref:hypothetical protein n=1 Tax=Bifidobacterium felsineum TaxID=2045440 RepID=UPI003B84ACD5